MRIAVSKHLDQAALLIEAPLALADRGERLGLVSPVDFNAGGWERDGAYGGISKHEENQ